MTHKLADVMIQTLPLSPPEATPVGACFSMATRGEAITYFSNLQPFDCHAAEDVNARHLRMARFHVVSGVGQGELANTFGVSRSTVTRAVKLFRDEGADGFFKQRRRRARTVVDAPMAKRAQAMLAQGLSGRAAARQLGVSPSTFNENLRAGVIVDGAKHDAREGCEPTHRAVRDTRDRHAPMGRAARDVEGRMLACAGLMTQVEPEFREPAHAVERGGVLAALPMLLSEGLLGAANRLLCLPQRLLRAEHHRAVRRLDDPGAGAQSREPALPGAGRMGMRARPGPVSGGQDPAPQDQAARPRRANGPGLAGGPGPCLARCAPGPVCDPRRGRPRQGVCGAQGQAGQALHRAPEAVPSGQRQLLDQRAGRQAAAVCAQTP